MLILKLVLNLEFNYIYLTFFRQKVLEGIQNWLKSLPSASEKRQKCNAEILDEYVVEAIEDVVNSHLVSQLV